MLAAEGIVHKRQRRVGTPAFSIQNLRSLVPLVFNKGNLLKEKWLQLGRESTSRDLTLDVCHWLSRATFDVIGVAGKIYMVFFIHCVHSPLRLRLRVQCYRRRIQ